MLKAPSTWLPVRICRISSTISAPGCDETFDQSSSSSRWSIW